MSDEHILGEYVDSDGVYIDDHVLRALFPPVCMYRPHQPVDLICTDASMTSQEFADEADINSIMRRYEKTGVVPSHGREGFYGEFADLPDFMEAQRIIMDAETAFAALPSRVRKEFDNDPAKFVEFASDPANVDQMRAWGLAEPAKAVETPLDPPKGEEPPKAATAPAASAAGA